MEAGRLELADAMHREGLVIGLESWIERLDNHPKDRHVAAAAMATGADAIVTLDTVWMVRTSGLDRWRWGR